MDTVHILNNINLNFNKLLASCKDGNTFTPPAFEISSDIDALIVLYQILHIIFQTRSNNTISNTILHSTLYQIINIKCKEFTNNTPWNSNFESFINSFEKYINSMIDNIMVSYNPTNNMNINF